MHTILTIAKKELYLNLMTFRFVVGTTLCVVLTAAFVPALMDEYAKRLATYGETTAKTEEELQKVKCYWSLRPAICRPPAALAIFAGGLESQIANSAKMDIGNVPCLEQASNASNPYLVIFPDLDVLLVIKIVIGLLALLMSYDAVSTERENGTLKLMLSNSICRHHILLGKMIAGLLTLIVSLVLAFLTVVLMLLLSPTMELGSEHWMRIGLMLLASIGYVVSIYNLGFLFSCISRRSSTSLMYAVLIWVIFLFVIPNISKALGSQIVPSPSPLQTDSRTRILQEQLQHELMDLNEVVKRGNLWGVPDAFGGFYYSMCDENALKYLNQCFKHNEPLRITCADKIGEIRDRYLDALMRQRSVIAGISRVSPGELYENVMSALARTDAETYREYVRQLRQYRASAIDYIRAQTDSFASPLYFTQGSAPEDWDKFFWKGPEMRKKHGEAVPPLPLTGFPRLIYRPPGIAQSLQVVAVDLALLLAAGLLFFTISYVCFLRYDVR